MEEAPEMEGIVVSGAALSKDEAKLTFRGVPDRPGIAARVMGGFADASINVDMIIQNTSASGLADMSLTVPTSMLDEAREIAGTLAGELQAAGVEVDDGIAKLSVVGIGMRSHTGVAEKMFAALAEHGINIQLISTSEIKISVIVDAEDSEDALRAVHEAFQLEKAPAR